jgi:hypothetical protein
MWHLKNIPRVLHLYWGASKLSYLRYLTLETFHYYNPDWEIRFYYPKESVKTQTWTGNEQKYAERWDDWTSMIDGSYVDMIEVPWEEPRFKNMSEVHRSDYFRWKLLSTVGGLWADFDILFFRSIDNLAINIPQNKDKQSVVCISGYGHSIGFMMASLDDTNFAKLAKESLRLYDIKDYQCIGSTMFNKLFPTINSLSNAVNLGMEAVYFYDASWMKLIFTDCLSPEENPTSIGVHWYAGSQVAGKFLADTNGGINSHKSLLGKLIKNYEGNLYKYLQ